MGKRRRKSGNKGNTKSVIAMADRVVKVFHQSPSQVFNPKQVAAKVNAVRPHEKAQVQSIIDDLLSQRIITINAPGRYQLNFVEEIYEGHLESIASGSGFVIVPELENDVFVHWRKLNRALNGDKVKVKIYPGRKKPEGEIVEVVSRRKDKFVGTVEIQKKFAFFVPDDEKVSVDFYIPLSKLNGAEEGKKVLATISDWPADSRNPFGKILEVLGDADDNEVVMHSILYEYGLPTKFPQDVEEYAETIPLELDEEEVRKNRRDMRGVTTFTIDPADAKDFDDALSVKPLENGNWEIGVHIADVSHYMPEGSILDTEAYERATSIYLVDRVIPMLPEKLSNGVCSLRPNEDKYCFSAIFEMDKNGKVVDEWFGRTAIHSDHRFAYEEAQEIIEKTSEGPFKEEVLLLDGLAKKLRRERLKKGGITFDRVEVKFNLDENGKPTGVYFKKSKDANKLIEEFMLLANKRVAKFIGDKAKKERTFVYRIHDKPSPEKFDQFANFVTQFGYDIHTSNEDDIAKKISKLLVDVNGKKEGNMLETLAIRTMAKAEYSTNNIGHYGLSFEYYSHFTSPIRRYPDVMVHRLLQHYLDGGSSADKSAYEEMCIHCSKMEKTASDAERDSIKYKQVEFMADHIGEVFDAVVSGVTDWGIYAEVEENLCEGMISVKTIEDDDYVLDQDNYCLVGRRYGKRIRIGDKLKIRIKAANLKKKQLDYEWVQEDEQSEEPEVI
jgi:ribonuclease R